MKKSASKPSGGQSQAAAEKEKAIETEFNDKLEAGKLPTNSPPPVLIVDNPIPNATRPKLVILADGHEWGITYRDVAVKKKKPVGSDETKSNTERAYYVKGLDKYLEAFPRAWEEWNAKLRGRFNSLALARPNIVAHHETYYRILAKQNAAGAAPPAPQGVPQQQKQPQPRPPPPVPMMVEDPNQQQQKQSGFKQPSKRPKHNALPPGQNHPVVVKTQPPPNRLDEEVTRLKGAFYKSMLLKSTSDLSYRTTPKISYEDIETKIRDTRGAYALKAPGLGLGYMLAHADSHAVSNALWSDWAGQYNKNQSIEDQTIEFAWKSFFEELRMSNYDESSQIIDPKTMKLRPGVIKINRGPLRLTYRGHGTYNIVYTAPEEAEYNEKLRSKFPPSIQRMLGSVVFRVPIRDMSEREPLPVVAAARELANCIEAADGGFGPPVWVGSAFVEGMESNVDVCELFTISTRMSMTIRELYDPVPAAILQEENMFNNLKLAIEHTMKGLSDVVFAYSVRRIIHLDASLLNFMVQMNGNPQTFPDRILSARKVYAIDLDPKLYRAVECNSTDTSKGWIFVWLYNVLFLSCMLKANVPSTVFDCWINQRVIDDNTQATLKNVISSTMGALKSGWYGSDCNWAITSRWKEPIGNWAFSGNLRKNSSSEMELEIRELCKHYFISIPERETEDMLQRFIKPEGFSEEDRENAATRYNLVCTPYSIPTSRYFKRRLASQKDAQAPLLVDVLFGFLGVDHNSEFPPNLHKKLLPRGPKIENDDYDSWMGRLDGNGSWPR